jgi:hypothetical protein
MPMPTANRRSTEALRDGRRGRYLSLRIDLRTEKTGELLIRAGGLWDRDEYRYLGAGTESAIATVHPGQEEAARWWAGWLRAYLGTPGARAQDAFRARPKAYQVYSMGGVGGRRSGKSMFLGGMALPQFCVAVKGAVVWAVSPTKKRYEEIRRAIARWVPRAMAKWKKSDGVYEFANGSMLYLRSGYDPDDLKQGEAHVILLNEAQEMPEEAYVQARGAIADTGGLVILAANPPKTSRGMWVDKWYEETRAGKREAVVFDFDPTRNPHVVMDALRAMEAEVDERTYRREVLGEFLPRNDIVLHAWSPRENVKPIPPGLREVTGAFLQRHHGRPFACAIGADFQHSPHMAAVIYRMYEDPDGGEPLLWITDEAIVEQGWEDDLVDALEAKGLRGDECVVIPDASGDWQGADRKQTTTSWEIFRRRGWRHLFKPSDTSKRNPAIADRVKIANARICAVTAVDERGRASAWKRRLFSLPTNLHANTAAKLWPTNKGGHPSRQSEYAHVGDAMTYPPYRWYAPRPQAGRVEYRSISTNTRADELKGY